LLNGWRAYAAYSLWPALFIIEMVVLLTVGVSRKVGKVHGKMEEGKQKGPKK
jgi:hypothetical protein